MIAASRSATIPSLASIAPLLVASLVTLTGCSDDSSTVREIQAQRHRQVQSQSRQDHLGEAFGLLERLVELNQEKAQRQIAYHFNRWREGRGETSAIETPELISTVNDIVPPDVLTEMVQRESFASADVSHLRDCYLFRQITLWVDQPQHEDPLLIDWLAQLEKDAGVETADKVRTAARLFDWTVRNIAFEPKQLPSPLPNPPAIPLGMTFQGPGYRQSDYQTVWRGTGDSLQRSGVFTQLCRQVSIPAFVLALQSDETGELTPWCVGVLAGDEVYLFEPELGIFVPGPDQTGIATLAQARSDESVIRRLNVPGFFDYPLTTRDIQQSTALLNVIPIGVSGRMRLLESGLTGDRRMVVYSDIDALAEQIDAVSGIAGVRMWRVPMLAEVYRAALDRAAQRDPIFSFWYFSRWAILDAGVGPSESLARGRWQHLQGQFEDDDVEGIKGARSLYLKQRAPEFEIEKLDIDVDLQIAYGIRRELGMATEVYERQIEQVQGIMRLGKRTATYWLSLIQYDDQRFENAENWLSKRALDEEQLSFWEPAARYNLARTYERLSDNQRAIELYKTSDAPQEHGNRIRARLLARQSE